MLLHWYLDAHGWKRTVLMELEFSFSRRFRDLLHRLWKYGASVIPRALVIIILKQCLRGFCAHFSSNKWHSWMQHVQMNLRKWKVLFMPAENRLSFHLPIQSIRGRTMQFAMVSEMINIACMHFFYIAFRWNELAIIFQYLTEINICMYCMLFGICDIWGWLLSWR